MDGRTRSATDSAPALFHCAQALFCSKHETSETVEDASGEDGSGRVLSRIDVETRRQGPVLWSKVSRLAPDASAPTQQRATLSPTPRDSCSHMHAGSLFACSQVAPCCPNAQPLFAMLVDLSLKVAMSAFTEGSTSTCSRNRPSEAKASSMARFSSCGELSVAPSPPQAFATPTKSGEGPNSQPIAPSKPKYTRLRRSLSNTMTSNLCFVCEFAKSCFTVPSSLMVIWMPPSPATTTLRPVSPRIRLATMPAQRP
mmetsp:Transcript_41147/g.107117  ORF Transcript_41147/g.107117 Transcript_41147/m.107117 type:complete len:255 (-) Transcript_41147:1055-1819(-)